MSLARLRQTLGDPVSAQSLAALRILFGAILTWDCIRYIQADRIRRYYVDVEMTFPYFGWDFIQPVAAPYIYWLWGLVGVSAALVMVGLFFRAAIVTFILTFGYFFLLDRAQYLNHNYMVLLYAVLLALSPAGRAWSVDAWLRPRLAQPVIPRWPVAAVRLQTEIILIYAGIVKITDEGCAESHCANGRAMRWGRSGSRRSFSMSRWCWPPLGVRLHCISLARRCCCGTAHDPGFSRSIARSTSRIRCSSTSGFSLG